jgi:predicted dehydrogenase
MLRIGVIGYGNRITGIVDKLISTGEVQLAAITDIRNDVIRDALEKKGTSGVAFYTDADEMMQKEPLDGVLIGTRCSTHTDYAVRVAKYGLPLFLEKPVCTNYKDLARLYEMLPSMNEKTVVSFPLRVTSVFEKVKEIVDSGRLGKIEHIQAYNNVPYGRGYYHKWYRDENETGGLFLQKATHDLDYLCALLGDNKPVRICAMKSKQIFKGDEPAGKKCADCEKAAECPESPENVKKLRDGYIIGEYCCFAADTGNEDSGSCMIEFESGMHLVYSQNFIVRGLAGKRGARLVGYLGTLEFDWNKKIITVYSHTEMTKEEISPEIAAGGHYGGDINLVQNFLGVMKGTEKSVTPLLEGIRSAKLCLSARESSEKHIFIDIQS